MPDFLSRMATESRRRVEEASAREPANALRDRIASMSPAPALPASHGFDLIAEVKRRSPSEGMLPSDPEFEVTTQAEVYAAAGAAAVSVLTEPAAFAGRLQDLADVASAIPGAAMRKDFLVDAYQVLEARALGAGGVLLIVRLLDDAAMATMVETAVECGLFVLFEAFDQEDLQRASRLSAETRERGIDTLVGVNCRDLRTLSVEPTRFAELAGDLRRDVPTVAESGLFSKLDVARVAGMGYRYALVGTALMRSREPGRALERMIQSGRAEARRR